MVPRLPAQIEIKMEQIANPVTANGTNTRTSIKKNIDTDLKASIIEFMRERPFLWNCKHPKFKDHRKRDHEFQLFSNEINRPVQEIKRVWHVLRTNFSRAHKLLLDRPPPSNSNGGENGEKLWKYYLAMEYILEGSVVGDGESSREALQRRTCSQRTPAKDSREAKAKKEPSCEPNSNNNDNIDRDKNDDNKESQAKNTRLNGITKSSHNLGTSFEEDEDNLYARSITSILKRFDPTTKEIIKLKFQEIIVNHMKQQQQQLLLLQKQKQQQQQHVETPSCCADTEIPHAPF